MAYGREMTKLPTAVGGLVATLAIVLPLHVAALSAPHLSTSTAFGPITAGGNCSTNGTLEGPARVAADDQLDDFLAVADRDDHATALFPDTDVGSLGTTPYALAVPGTDLVVSMSLYNVTAADAGGATSTTAMSWGTQSTSSAPSLLFGSTEQLQDCAPKPIRLVSSAEGGPLASPTAYWTVSGFGSTQDQTTLDSAFFSFSEPVDNFGAWFGDLETRLDDVGNGDGGELGYIKLYDSAGTVLAVEPIVPNVQTAIAPATPFGCGGGTGADPSACGNHGTRFLGFTWDTPDVAAFQVIVGDDDHCVSVPSDCDGTNERLSFIGPTYAFDDPVLTFDKVVVNDHFGDAIPGDFTFELVTDPGGAAVVSTHTSGDTVPLDVGVEHAVREVAVGGYTNTAVACATDEASPTGNVDVPVAPDGFTPTLGNARFACTFTNDDDPALIPLSVEKVVINDDGGTAGPSDFVIDVRVDGVSNLVGSGDTIDLNSSAGVVVSEVSDPGYSLVSIECTDDAGSALGSAFAPAVAMVSIACIVTNDDIAASTTTAPTTPPTTDGPTTTATPSTAPPTSEGPATELPATGGSSKALLQLAFPLLLVGVALTAATRRRTLRPSVHRLSSKRT